MSSDFLLHEQMLLREMTEDQKRVTSEDLESGECIRHLPLGQQQVSSLFALWCDDLVKKKKKLHAAYRSALASRKEKSSKGWW